MKKSINFKFAMFIIAFITLLIGCAPKSTGVQKSNHNNTYNITVADEYVEAKKIAYSEAKQECQKQGKEAVIINERAIPWRYSVHEFIFKCLDKNDSEMQQPVFR